MSSMGSLFSKAKTDRSIVTEDDGNSTAFGDNDNFEDDRDDGYARSDKGDEDNIMKTTTVVMIKLNEIFDGI